MAVAIPIDGRGAGTGFTIDTHLIVDEDVAIHARKSGIVEDIFVERGTRVRKGDLLLELRNRDLELAVRRAEIAVRRERSEFERIKKLFEERAISPSDFERSQLDYQGASVELDIAREELEKSLVRAPFDGLIVDRYAKVGQKVIEEENLPLFRLSRLSPLQARLYLPERVARALSVGDRVAVLPRYVAGVRATGRVEWISPVIDASSGTSLAIVSVAAAAGDPSLLPGSAVTVTLDIAGGERAVLVPRSALGDPASHLPGRAAMVEVVEGERRSWRRVRLGEVRGGDVEVLEGLRAGDRVVLRPESSGKGLTEPQAGDGEGG
ncbi:MAG: efflux RND transporter periplasmic adaptor subunit [Acidobacteriota bacterium]